MFLQNNSACAAFTHCGLVSSNSIIWIMVTTGPGDTLSPVQQQAFTWIVTLTTSFSNISIKIWNIWLKKILKMLPIFFRPQWVNTPLRPGQSAHATRWPLPAGQESIWDTNLAFRIKTLRPRDKIANILRISFSNEILYQRKFYILINVTPKFVPKGWTDDNSALVKLLACWWTGNLSVTIMTQFPQICTTRPQWVNIHIDWFSEVLFMIDPPFHHIIYSLY